MERRRSGLWSAYLRMLNKARLLLPVLPRLGFANVANVAGYRLALASGLIKKAMPVGHGYHDPLFHGSCHLIKDLRCHVSESGVVDLAEDQLKGDIFFFSDQKYNVGSPPDWFFNPVNQKRYPDADLHWSRLPDFSDEVGDIKIIWEASRFDWALVFARAYRVSGDEKYLLALNKWASDWTEKNPLNRGPNWKCGQEAAIRMLQALLAAFLLNQHKSPASGLMRFVFEHCRRIAPTVRYAIAQDNNHGVSEAGGLFVGGAWLVMVSEDPQILRNAGRWARKGRTLLEDRVDRLIERDGSFSQYSINYHRLALDMLSIVEFWRRELDHAPFSADFYEKAGVATNWLFHMTDSLSGDAPNVGANDGVRLFVLTDTPYRDYRPSVQLASVLFWGCPAYGTGVWDECLGWLGLDDVEETKNTFRRSYVFADGGYAKLKIPHSRTWGIVRFPCFRFRPGHADLLHFDLWHDGVNVLRDGGSYSYNTDSKWLNYFSGTASHNTVQFDGRDQMPRVGRFLFGAWPKGIFDNEIGPEDDLLSWSASYQDFRGCRHKRTIKVKNNVWQVIDEIDGFENEAVLRWRLAPGDWHLNGQKCCSDAADILVKSSVPITRCEIVKGWESRCYMKMTELPVLEVSIGNKPATLITKFDLKLKS